MREGGGGDLIMHGQYKICMRSGKITLIYTSDDFLVVPRKE